MTGGVLQFLCRHWFLISLAAGLAIGFGPSDWLQAVAHSAWLRSGLVATVLLVMGLPVHAGNMLGSLRRPGAAILAVLMNAAGVPLLAAVVAPLLPTDLAGGLIVAAAVPCTLASASVWTRRAGGDDAVAMVVTIVTNLFCFLIAPFWLALLLQRTTNVDWADQVIKLGLLVALPLLAAQLLRRAGCAAWADRHKRGLSTAAQVGILIMVTLGAVETRRRFATGQAEVVGIAGWLAMVLLAAGVHLAALYLGLFAARAARMTEPQRRAVGIAGSQKTLMVGLQIAIDCGVSMLPMIAYHVSQLVLDTVIADRWAGRSSMADAAEPTTGNIEKIPR